MSELIFRIQEFWNPDLKNVKKNWLPCRFCLMYQSSRI